MTTPYRSDREALEQRLTALQAELTTALAELSALEGASGRKQRIEQEILEVAEKLARSRGVGLLESIRIASPCKAAWGDMVGDARMRLCGSCDKNVYDIAKMTREEAEALIATNETACVRLWRRRDGTVMTSDCPVGVRRKRLKRVAATAFGSALVAGAMLVRWRTTSCNMELAAGGIGPAPVALPEPSATPANTVTLLPVEATTPAPARPPPTATVVVGPPVTTGGVVANAAAVAAGMSAGFRRCYAKGLGDDASIAGALRVTAKIGANGEVLSATWDDGAGLSGAVIACAVARVRSAQFAPPDGGGATIVIPIQLAPR